MLAPRVESE